MALLNLDVENAIWTMFWPHEIRQCVSFAYWIGERLQQPNKSRAIIRNQTLQADVIEERDLLTKTFV